ncbi:MAG: right-handed parallel beta-helix repeat-containing protein [Verrucomicrobiales bacterium]
MNPRHPAASASCLVFLLSIALFAAVSADEPPGPTSPPPRQTSGDSVVEPDWNERLTVSVGTKDGDIVGTDHRAIQAAIDHVARLGGGTVHILAGTYRLRHAVALQSRVHLRGAGADTVLIKEPSVASPLSADSDWYDQEITLENPEGFRLGDGVCLRAKNPANGAAVVLKRTLVARTGPRFKLDRPLRENLWVMHGATAATLFPILSGDHIEDVRIEHLTLDGNRAHNDELDGNYAGCIFLQDCNRIAIRGVTARDYHGDGISWQVCHDVVVEDCVSENHTGLGLHPGSGSQRPVIRNNMLRGNGIGLFFCWGVKHGVAENNRMLGNRIGISIGHRDTDNLIAQNHIEGSSQTALLFRAEPGPAFAGHRNRIHQNTFVDNGPEGAPVIDIQGPTKDISIRDNTFSDARSGTPRPAVKKGPETADIVVEDNSFSGSVTR